MATEVAESALGNCGVAIAKAIAVRACHVCATKSALWYCAADDAYLCTACDTQVHSANALSMRHERVRLTSDGTPKKRSSQSNLVPEDVGMPARKRSRTSRPYSHHLRKLTRLSSELVEAKARDSESVELNFDFLDAGEFLCSDAEVPSVSPACSDEVEFFAPDLDEFLEGDHTATSDSFTAFLKGKAAHSEHVAIDNDQFLVPDAAFGDDLCGVNTSSNVDVANDAFFFPGDIPGLDAFAAPEMDLSDDFAITFDLALQNNNSNNPLDAFEGNATVSSHVTGAEPTDSDQFMAGPFAKFFATKVKSEAEEPMGAERIRREAREMLKCCEGERVMPCLTLDVKEVLSAWSNRGEPWVVDFKVPQSMHSDDSTSSGSDSGGLVQELDGDRDARVMRYKEKRRTRLFSKKIRYEVRKLNAERRPRMKGRFVKRTSL